MGKNQYKLQAIKQKADEKELPTETKVYKETSGYVIVLQKYINRKFKEEILEFRK